VLEENFIKFNIINKVIVETEQVASQLLKQGNLKRRVTIIPLNKISAAKISADVKSYLK
jgi:structural maintenance of chromosome 2